MSASSFPSLLQSFFTDRLIRQQRASAHTISSYRDTFRLLLQFAANRHGKAPTELELEDLDACFIGEFLDHLERDRGNSPRTRNTRLAAVRSFFRYAALNEPRYTLVCQRVVTMPNKRFVQRAVEFLHRSEVDALLAAPDPSTWIGRRDRTLLLIAVQTGLRVSELIWLRNRDVVLGIGAHIRCVGKGRKQRCTPLRPDSVAMVKAWLREQRDHDSSPSAPFFPSLRRGHLSRDAVERLVAKHAATASAKCPSLAGKHVTPHVLRHTVAMDLLQHGVDRSVIALWLGHESPETTQIYIHADLRIKERALARVAPSNVKPRRYRPNDRLLAFLEAL